MVKNRIKYFNLLILWGVADAQPSTSIGEFQLPLLQGHLRIIQNAIRIIGVRLKGFRVFDYSDKYSY